MPTNDTLGSVPEMLAWANSIITSRPPDFIIEDGDKKPYMQRWFVVPRNPAGGCYIHRILRSDKDTHHDHPWDNTSFVLDGEYDEEVLVQKPNRRDRTEMHRRVPGDIVKRKATDAHRLILAPDAVVTTLFYLGPWQRDWGFHCPGGWIPWWEFTETDKGRVGRGCGEYA